ncbi:hypothetical protein ACH9EU_14865 [Kocuria sp. M1R5S2]|uniref:hypothetical protein n=1 Tax=Kocuria rhizosphaerae TaxID=3376285 RepID=UPI0037A5EA02
MAELPWTTVGVDAPLPRIPVRVDSMTAIRQDSFIMVDELSTAPRGAQVPGRV